MMTYSLAAFSEPRGVMRVLQFVFAICAFATTSNFSIELQSQCGKNQTVHNFDYPFRFSEQICESNTVSVNVTSDAQFFVATGVLSLMYCIFIIAVYAFLDELYRSKNEIPLADFMLTTILAIFWLSGSAAWSNGTSAIKTETDPASLQKRCSECEFWIGSFSKLNISLILGFLNFFLWASDLWFLYKETIWFQGRQQTSASGGGGVPSMGGGNGPGGSLSPNVQTI